MFNDLQHHVRHFLIKLLAGDLPIVLNVNIVRPKGYSGKLVHIPATQKYGMFCDVYLTGSGDIKSNISIPLIDGEFPLITPQQTVKLST